MALLTLVRASARLQNQAAVTVAMPDTVTGPLRTLWLLHGLGDNGSAWQRKTGIEQLAIAHNLAIVMPDMGRSFYVNTASHQPYWDYLTQELMPQLQATLPLSTAPADRYVAGNSMGGFGALRLAAAAPERFAAVMLLSPVVDLDSMPPIMPDYESVFAKGTPHDLIRRELQAAPVAALRRLRWYHTIGDEDFMKAANDDFARFATRTLGLTLTQDNRPGGHDWAFWGPAMARVLDWLDSGASAPGNEEKIHGTND
ncbi:alpha/beta hydrolase [Lacticaseibacillus kribbianus]|uniref:alpha/beta hydrolase n=1 Tax=Lacticaseibacillus kribbianus TaxID=2926292 RepID=UPI001CD7180D|nr:alpha/beta fold hydrolase [Lacticaseibacillus kribbianus]